MSKPKLPPGKIGTFRMGFQNVDLVAILDEHGGEFYLCPDNTSLPRIKVGIAYTNWDECVATLLHEALEVAACLTRVRYYSSGKLNGDNADYLFVFDHSEFGHMCSMVATFVTPALPELAKAWNKLHKVK